MLAFPLLLEQSAPRPGNTLHVPGTVPTIQGAIVRARDFDTIVVAPGTYPEAIDFLGKTIVVTSTGGAAVTTIDAGSVATTVSFSPGGPAVLRGFTITGGYSYSDGGGIRCAPGVWPRIEDCVVRGNSVNGNGGGLAGDAELEGCTITDNFALGNGAGVAGGARLVACTFERNVSYGVGGGVWCRPGSRPWIEGCTFRSNTAIDQNGVGGAVFGDPWLEDCVIEDNVGIAVFGAPVIRRCVLRRNSAYDSAALYLIGGRVEDSAVVENAANDGSGGGAITIAGPGVVLLRCVVARNHQNTYSGYATRGVAVQYSPFGGGTPARLENCVIVDNRVDAPSAWGGDVGGVFGPAELVNTILGGNDFDQYDPVSPVSASYSDVEGGLAGLGNFDADPLFVDFANGDYRLRPGSPCIDAGSPGTLDPDCTRVDVGASWFPQTAALVTLRNGAGVNPVILSSLNDPRLGATWTARVDASGIPGATLVGLAAYDSALEPGLPTIHGELLVRGQRFFLVSQPSSGSANDFPVAIPNDPALACATVHVQAFVQTATGVQLTNALAVQIGR